jgi:acyl-CoA synthetase (NDP forming)
LTYPNLPNLPWLVTCIDTLSAQLVNCQVSVLDEISSEERMKIHEYQAKQILARYNVRIPRGEVAYTKEEAREVAERIEEL